VFTAYEVEEYVYGAMQAGAKGYVLKGSPAPELVRAIRHVHGGGTYLLADDRRQSSPATPRARAATPAC